MSRSYKKHPITKDNAKWSKWAKNQANRHFRRNKNQVMLSGKSMQHRKYYSSYDIHDYISLWTKEEAEAEWAREEYLIAHGVTDGSKIRYHLQFKTKRHYMRMWEKYTIRK